MHRTEIGHAYVVDFSQSSPGDIDTRRFEHGGNAPSHLCLGLPYFSADAAGSKCYTDDPTPEAQEKERLRKIRVEENRIKREAEAQARRDKTAEQAKIDKAARDELSRKRKAEEVKRKKEERAKEIQRKRDTLYLNCNSDDARERIRARYREQKRLQRERAILNGAPHVEKPEIPPGYIPMAEASRQSGVGASTICNYTKDGSIPMITYKRYKYVVLADVLAEREKRAQNLHLHNLEFGARRKEAAAIKASCKAWDDEYILSSPTATATEGGVPVSGK